MKALVVESFNSPPTQRDVIAPVPGPGQLGIAIKACALNFADLLMLGGTYQDTPALPFVPGMEIAGIVTSVGAQSLGFAPGDRVAAFCGNGGLAESAVVDAARCVHLPAAMGFDQAAAFQVAYGTSHLALTRRAQLQKGETLLVLGAAGGVGLTAVEIGKHLGATVIAVARGAQKLEVAAQAGADHLIDAEAPDLREQIKALGGADVVYDAVGGDLFMPALRACNPEARYLAIGFASGDIPQVPANILLVKNISVIGFYWGGYLGFAPHVLTENLAELFELWAQGHLAPHISHRFPLAEADQALSILRSRKSTGKVVVEP